MSEQAVSGETFTLAGSLRGRQRAVPVRQPPSVLSSIVALMSHDLRLPLAAILANAEFLTQPGLSEIERNDFYGEIRSAIDRMNEMVSSLLECAKGVDMLRPGVRNIVDTVELAIRLTSVLQEFRGITITHHHFLVPSSLVVRSWCCCCLLFYCVVCCCTTYFIVFSFFSTSPCITYSILSLDSTHHTL